MAHVADRPSQAEARAAICALARTDGLMRWAADFADRPVKVILMTVRSKDGTHNVPWHVHDVLSLSHGTCQDATAGAIDALVPFAGQGDLSPFEFGSATLRAESRSRAAFERDLRQADKVLRSAGCEESADLVLSERRSVGLSKSRPIYIPRSSDKWFELMTDLLMLDPCYQLLPTGRLHLTVKEDGSWTAVTSEGCLRLSAGTSARMDYITSRSPQVAKSKMVDDNMKMIATIVCGLKRASIDAFIAEQEGRDRL